MTPNKFKNAKKSHLAQKSYGSTFCDMSHHTKSTLPLHSSALSFRIIIHQLHWRKL